MKNALIKVQHVPLHFTREIGNMLTSIFNSNAHLVYDCWKPVHVWRKSSSYGDVLYHLYHVMFEGYRRVFTTYPHWIYETAGIFWLIGTVEVYASVPGRSREKRVCLFLLSRKALVGCNITLPSFPYLVSWYLVCFRVRLPLWRHAWNFYGTADLWAVKLTTTVQ